MEPNGFDAYKPWALASTFGVLSLQDDTTGANAMAIDVYINAYAVNAGKTIDSVETYAFQGGIFDGLSAEYQEAYLDASLAGYEGMLNGEAADEAAQALAQAQQEQIAAMFDAWKNRTPMPWRRSTTKRPSSTVMTSSTPSCSPSGTPA